MNQITATPVKRVADDKLPEGLLDFPFTVDGSFTQGIPPISFLGGFGFPANTQYYSFQPQYSGLTASLTQIRCLEFSLSIDTSATIGDGAVTAFFFCPGENRIIYLCDEDTVPANTGSGITVQGCLEINLQPSSTVYLIAFTPSADTGNVPLVQGFLNFTNYKKDQYFNSLVLVPPA
jgi:hypothetical protein